MKGNLVDMTQNKKNKYPNPNPIYGDYGSKKRADFLKEAKDMTSIPEFARVRWWKGWIFHESEIEDAERQAQLLYEKIEDMREHNADSRDIDIREWWLRGVKYRFDTYRRRREIENWVRWGLPFIVSLITAFFTVGVFIP